LPVYKFHTKDKRMKNFAIAIALVATTSLMASADGASKWGYGGVEGPEYWGHLSDKYIMCKEGKHQSPIDITDHTEADMETLQFDYKALAKDFINNGHTVQVNIDQGSNLVVDNKKFELKQFHFHTPSENHVDGKSHPMEMHLVHASADGSLAVVAVMFSEGGSNPFIKTLTSNIPKKAKDHIDLKELKLNVYDFLPVNRDYYRFAGSLTTPPCSEGVRWLVLKTAVEASKEELATFRAIMGENNRPLQPIHAREVLK